MTDLTIESLIDAVAGTSHDVVLDLDELLIVLSIDVDKSKLTCASNNVVTKVKDIITLSRNGDVTELLDFIFNAGVVRYDDGSSSGLSENYISARLYGLI